MSSDVANLLLTGVLWLTDLTAIYCTLVLAADALLAAWDRRRNARDRLRRLGDQADVSVQRIGAAFVVAQQLIRDEATAQRGDRR